MDQVVDQLLLDGRYALNDVIGQGGMARVHHATDRLLNRDVAVKVLDSGAEDPSFPARFQAEARTLASLSHPHLVTLLDAGLDQGRRYIVLELVEGGTLRDLIRQGAVDSETVAEIGRGIADALAHAHAAGIVHRDVKPANVLLGANGPKLADFGIARLLHENTSHTATGLMLGTAAYLSPEQVRGEGATTSSDVYALGLVLLEALTGERLYDGTPVEAAVARLSKEPDIPEHLDARWHRVLRAMTALDAADRPDAAEAARLLGELTGRSAKRQPAGSVANDESGAEGVPTQFFPAPLASPAPAATQPRRLRRHLLVAAAVAPLLAGGLALAQGGGGPDGTAVAAAAGLTSATVPAAVEAAVTLDPVATTDRVSTRTSDQGAGRDGPRTSKSDRTPDKGRASSAGKKPPGKGKAKGKSKGRGRA